MGAGMGISVSISISQNLSLQMREAPGILVVSGRGGGRQPDKCFQHLLEYHGEYFDRHFVLRWVTQAKQV